MLGLNRNYSVGADFFLSDSNAAPRAEPRNPTCKCGRGGSTVVCINKPQLHQRRNCPIVFAQRLRERFVPQLDAKP
jgi:hypothetical protein